MFEANTNTDAKEKHSDLANDKKQKFKKIYASIHKDIAQQTTEFLEFAEANGAFDWQAGKIPTSDYQSHRNYQSMHVQPIREVPISSRHRKTNSMQNHQQVAQLYGNMPNRQSWTRKHSGQQRSERSTSSEPKALMVANRRKKFTNQTVI